MGLNLDEKKAVVTEVSAQIATAQSIILAEYSGIQVSSLTKLRAQARKSGVYLRVLKNKLVRRAVEGTPFACLAEHMKGPLIYGMAEDPISAAKLLHEFARGNDKLSLKAGSYAGKLFDRAGVVALASIPGREELLARLLGIMQAPVSGFAAALAALAKKREEAAEETAAEAAT